MTGSDNHEGGEHHLSELPTKMLEVAVEEWNDRTIWGKLTYPAWFINSVLQWCLVLGIVGSVLFVKEYNNMLDEGWEDLKDMTPSTYKNRGGEGGE